MDGMVTEDRLDLCLLSSVFLSATQDCPGGTSLLFMAVKHSSTLKGYWLSSLHNLKST